MSPPTEQLIRDYLNRLSVAARGRLNSDDRRALVTRTHDFIERNASRSGPPIPMEVAALLSRLGDPGALVDQEVARLAAARGETVVPEADQANGLAARLRRRTANASWHWPTAAAHPDLVTELLNGNGGNGAKPPPTQPTDPAAVVPRQPGPADPDAKESGSAAPPGGSAPPGSSGPPGSSAQPSGPGQPAPPRPVWPVAAPDLGARGGAGSADIAGSDRPGALHAQAGGAGSGDEPAGREPAGGELGAGEPGERGPGIGELGIGAVGQTRGVAEPDAPEPDAVASGPGAPAPGATGTEAGGGGAGGSAKVPEPPLAESVTHYPAEAGAGRSDAPSPSATPRSHSSATRQTQSSATRQTQSSVTGQTQPSATRQTQSPAGRLAGDGPSRVAPARAWIRSLPGRGLALSRRHPLEATAIVLLGLGGVIFPPVWLLGAGVAVPSREWDYRDKWAGLVGPVVLLVIGTTVGLALGHPHHQLGAYLHEAWVYLNILSRLCAVAGTWYLCWRLTHARQAPDVPPWNRPRRVD